MMHPTGALPNEAYADGLRRADGDVVRRIYAEFRQPILRAMAQQHETSAGADFQASVVAAARLADTGRIPENVPFFFLLKNLALQFHQLRLTDHPQTVETIVPAEGEPELGEHLPATDEMREIRREIDAWTQSPEAAGSSTAALVWHKTRAIEKRLADGLPLAPPSEPGINRGWRYALLTVATLTLGYALFAWWTRPKTPEKLFEANFNPPESFLADRTMRYDAAPPGDTTDADRASECERLLRESDRLYQAGKFEEAQEPLLLVVLDTGAVCQSDAWYFLSLLRLELGDPQTAIDCLTKIEDYEHFGEDIQWHMALAFVQLAEQNPGLQEKARRALEKVLTSPQSETRHAQAQAMLDKLGQ